MRDTSNVDKDTTQTKEVIAMFTTIKEYFQFSKTERVARNLVRSYFPQGSVEFKKVANGTVRFVAMANNGKLAESKQGFYRVRSSKDRGLGSNHENSFDQVHIGKVTIAVERDAGRDLWNFAWTAQQS